MLPDRRSSVGCRPVARVRSASYAIDATGTGAGGSIFTAPGSGPGVRVARVTPRKDTHSQIRTFPIFAGCTEAELDEIFADYQQYYSDAEAVAHDYAATRSRRALKAGRRQGREQAAEAFAERRLRNRIRRKARSVFSVVRRTPAKSSD